jgi:hypothetical protein
MKVVDLHYQYLLPEKKIATLALLALAADLWPEKHITK